MKKNKQILLVILLLISFLDAQSSGTGSAAFLNKGMSARAIGMGSAYTAVVDDPTAVYWNPAGLLNSNIFQIQVSDIQDLNSTSFGDVNSPQLALSYCFRKPLPLPLLKNVYWALGSGVNSFFVKDIDQYDSVSNYEGSFNYGEYVVFFSTAFRIRFLKIGMTWKYIEQNFSLKEQFIQNNGRSWNLKPHDLGIMFSPTKYISVGLIIRDSCRVGIYDMYSRSTQMGIKFDLKDFKTSLPHLILATDIIVIQNSLNKMNLGLEYIHQFSADLSVAVRTGISNMIVGMKGEIDNIEEISQINLKGAIGLGLSYNMLNVDVAWVQEIKSNPYSKYFVWTISWSP